MEAIRACGNEKCSAFHSTTELVGKTLLAALAFLALLAMPRSSFADLGPPQVEECFFINNYCNLYSYEGPCPNGRVERTISGPPDSSGNTSVTRFCDFADDNQGTDLELGANVPTLLPGANVSTQVAEALGFPGGLPGSDTEGSCSPEGQGISYAGNPINIGSRNKVERVMDYVGPGRLPIVFSRTFNSADENTESFPPLGKKWSMSFARLERWVPPAGSGATEGLVNIRPDGQRIRYYRRDDASSGIQYFERVNGKFARILKDTSDNSWRLLDGLIEERYDSFGRLVLKTDESGEYLKYNYLLGTSLYPNRINHSSGRFLQISYRSNGELDQITLPDGEVITYTHNARGNLETVTYPHKGGSHLSPPFNGLTTVTETYFYEDSNNPDSITRFQNAKGLNAYWTYTSTGEAVSSVHEAGFEKMDIIGTTTSGGTTSITTRNALGKDTVFNFQEIAGSTKLTSVDGVANGNCVATNRSMTYDAQGYYDVVVDREGNTIDYDYDGHGLLTQTIAGAGTPEAITTTYEFDTSLELPTRIANPASESTFSYDERGRPIERKVKNLSSNGVTNEVRTWTYSYPEAFRQDTSEDTELIRKVVIDGPRTDVSDTTTLLYDTSGRLQSITNALSQTLTVNSYDSGGRITKLTRPTGMTVEYEYHPRGWVTKITEKLATKTLSGTNENQVRVTEYAYDEVGNVERITYPDGSYYDFYYNAQDLPFRVDNANGEMMWYDYDDEGNITRERVRHEETTTTWEAVCCTSWGEPYLEEVTTTEWVTDKEVTFTYDALGRIETYTDGVGNTSEYRHNKNDLPRWFKNPRGYQTTTTYDPLNRFLIRSNPDGGATGYGYDSAGFLDSVNDPIGVVTSFSVDGFGDVVAESSADIGTATSEYDLAGNIESYTDARMFTTQFADYDALNRITRIDHPSGIDTVFVWDTDQPGYLHQVTDDSGTTTFERNEAGEITKTTVQVSGVTFGWISDTMVYRAEFDVGGRFRKRALPGGTTLHYGYDPAGRVNEITADHSSWSSTKGVATNITYLPYGPLNFVELGAGQNRILDYDSNYRLEQIVSGSSTQRSYTYDQNSNIARIYYGTTGGYTQHYYDSMDRLTYVSGPAEYGTYRYDDNGNRIAKNNYTSDNYSYYTGTNRLGYYTGGFRSYDANGNTTSANGYTLNYDARNRLSNVVSSGTTMMSYNYNVFGERVRKHSSSFEQLFFYGYGARLLHERGSQGTVDYIYLNGEPIALVRNGTLRVIHTDHLGRPLSVKNESGSFAVWQSDGNAWESVENFAYIEVNLRFPGQYWDSETGFYYNYNRYYDPDTGRYLSTDPIGLAGGTNRYLYANANPRGNIDPLGLESIANIQFEQDVKDLMSGRISEEEYWERINARGAAAGCGFGVAGLFVPDPTDAWLAGFFGKLFGKKPKTPKAKTTDTVADTVPSGGAKNASGNLDDAAAAARTQPHGAVSRVTFGKNADQVEHAFRHTDAAGLSRSNVQSAISRDITQNGHLVRAGSNTRTVRVDGVDVTFNAHRLPDGTINVGRITPPRSP